jgi:predicted enzyme related to lactoylglutathione lyase
MLNDRPEGQLGRFCWVDLASADAGAAKSFYRDLFGWTARERSIGNGRFGTFEQADELFALSISSRANRSRAASPRALTAYVSVADVDAAVSKAASLGGEVIVPPHDVADFARISLILTRQGPHWIMAGYPWIAAARSPP